MPTNSNRPTGATKPPPRAPRPRTRAGTMGLGGQRKLSNFMIDRSLQLRYIVFVLFVSVGISAALGVLVYRQEHQATEALTAHLSAFTAGDADLAEFQHEEQRNMEASDSHVVLTMVGAGVGLFVVLSFYLVLFTHKVAGPLYKVSLYCDQMARGKVGNVTDLRQGDMLQDFFNSYREMHEAVRARLVSDTDAMARFIAACESVENARSGGLGAAVEALEAHVAARRIALS